MSDGFTQEQLAALQAKLDPAHVAQRQQAGRKLSYIEGWWAISEANRIFGHDCWHRETIQLRQLGEPYEKDGKKRVAYMARVRIEAFAGERCIIREGTGYGSGIDADLNAAHESAFKEAETDAMKRALMTFGNPFGLALYDKTQANVGVEKSRQELIAEVPDAQQATEFQQLKPKIPLPRKEEDFPIEAGMKGPSKVSAKSLRDSGKWPAFENGLDACKDLDELARFRADMRVVVVEEGWTKAWKNSVADYLDRRETEIIAAMSDKERSQLSVDKQFRASVAALPRLDGDDNPNYLIAGE